MWVTRGRRDDGIEVRFGREKRTFRSGVTLVRFDRTRSTGTEGENARGERGQGRGAGRGPVCTSEARGARKMGRDRAARRRASLTPRGIPPCFRVGGPKRRHGIRGYLQLPLWPYSDSAFQQQPSMPMSRRIGTRLFHSVTATHRPPVFSYSRSDATSSARRCSGVRAARRRRSRTANDTATNATTTTKIKTKICSMLILQRSADRGK